MSRAPANPFYTKQGGGGTNPSDAPQTYSSLSDLNAGKASATTGSSRARYVPPSMRAEGQAGYVATGTKGNAAAVAAARRVPPVPDAGMMPRAPDVPPRRTAGDAARPTGAAGGAAAGDGYMARAAAYIPESARTGASSAAATAGAGLASAGGYLREGVNNVVTPERADQVKSGVAKVGVGAAKLVGKGAWQLGKLASRST